MYWILYLEGASVIENLNNDRNPSNLIQSSGKNTTETSQVGALLSAIRIMQFLCSRPAG